MVEKPYQWSGNETERLMLRMLNLEHLAEPPENAAEASSTDADEDIRPATFNPRT